MCGTCRKERGGKIADQKNQYHAKKRYSSEAETCTEETRLSLAERSEDKESLTKGQPPKV